MNQLSIVKTFLRDYIKNSRGSFWIVSLSKETSPKQKYFKKPIYGAKFEDKISFFIDRNTFHNENIYFSLNSYRKRSGKLKRSKKHILRIFSIYFDIDKDTDSIVKKIIEEFGTPTFIIKTSENKKQLIYKLNESMLSSRMEEFESIQKKLIKYFKTDNTFDVTRIFRLPGLINHKSNYLVEYEYNEIKYDFKIFKYFAENITE